MVEDGGGEGVCGEYAREDDGTFGECEAVERYLVSECEVSVQHSTRGRRGTPSLPFQ